MSQDRHFNCDKIFMWLFALTALEVLWGYAFGLWFVSEGEAPSRLVLWGGLLFFAFYKGWLIAVYFMHLKFEGWVVKSLILPTPFLVMVIFGYVVPDIGPPENNSNEIGAHYDRELGYVVQKMSDNEPAEEHAEDEEGSDEPSENGSEDEDEEGK